jgi:hypothetical protein
MTSAARPWYAARAMLQPRHLLAAFLAFWLAFGPAASAWAQSAKQPCESMAMSVSSDDCCGEGMEQAECLGGCLIVAPAVAACAAQRVSPVVVAAIAANRPLRHASVLAPPDIAPPKPFVS